MKSHLPLELPDILLRLPHRTPFVFVDRVTALEPHKSIVAERLLRAEEPYFAGHFPGRPIMPGVLIAEALAQASGLLVGLSESSSPPPSFHLAGVNIKFPRPAQPGDTLELRSTLQRSLGGLFSFQVEAAVGAEIVAGGLLTLARVDNDPSTHR